MGLQVVSSVTFGALSAGELKVAMDTAVPPNLDNKQLAKWFRDRQAAQTKLRGFYIDIAKQASEEGKTPAEIMIEIEDKKSSTNKKEEATAEIPTAPPSGRQGGELRVDAAGNRAFVFPDGSFEEI